MMKNYEIHVYASYMVNENECFNCFKEYVEAKTAAAAKKALRAALKADGYKKIEMEAIEC